MIKINFKIFWFIIVIIFFNSMVVDAHPGRTDSDGCHTCRTNCEKWGLSYGEYHCHNGNSSTNSSKEYSPVYNYDSDIKDINDVVLNLHVDDNEFNLWDTKFLKYIDAVPESIKYSVNDSNTSVFVDYPEEFDYGYNKITFTLSNGYETNDRYLYIVIEEGNPFSGVILQVTVNDNKYFIQDSFKTALVGAELESFHYSVNDPDVSVKVSKPSSLKDGDNEIVFELSKNGKIQFRTLYLTKQEKNSILSESNNSCINEDFNSTKNSTLKNVDLSVGINNYDINIKSKFPLYLSQPVINRFSYKVNDPDVLVTVNYPQSIEPGENVITFELSRNGEVDTRTLYLTFSESVESIEINAELLVDNITYSNAKVDSLTPTLAKEEYDNDNRIYFQFVNVISLVGVLLLVVFLIKK